MTGSRFGVLYQRAYERGQEGGICFWQSKLLSKPFPHIAESRIEKHMDFKDFCLKTILKQIPALSKRRATLRSLPCCNPLHFSLQSFIRAASQKSMYDCTVYSATHKWNILRAASKFVGLVIEPKTKKQQYKKSISRRLRL